MCVAWVLGYVMISYSLCAELQTFFKNPGLLVGWRFTTYTSFHLPNISSSRIFKLGREPFHHTAAQKLSKKKCRIKTSIQHSQPTRKALLCPYPKYKIRKRGYLVIHKHTQTSSQRKERKKKLKKKKKITKPLSLIPSINFPPPHDRKNTPGKKDIR